jgi:hypothetical protein
MSRLAVAAGILILTALSWFEFPGHTWLQQDTQIYVPILEHLRDPSVLRRDLLVQSPHVSFTLYDETARALAWVTGAGFREVLEGEQFVTRALGIWGLYLMAAAVGLSAPASLLVAGAISLGASIPGPAVLTMELEPDPRGFAVPLLWLAVGLIAHRRDLAAGIVGAAAFLIHPPTVLPFWGVYLCVLIWRRRFWPVVPLVAAGIVLALAARFQEGATEAQLFFGRLTPALESLQRWRAAYSWISEWWRDWLAQYLFLWVASWVAFVRIRKRAAADLRVFLIGLPLVGVLSVPASWLLLEKMKWSLMPQLQPMRGLLFVTLMAQFCGAAAGLAAAQARRFWEAVAWLGLVYVAPLDPNLVWIPAWNRVLAAGLLAAAATFAGWAESRKFRWSFAVLGGVAAAGFFVVPTVGGVSTHPELHTPELAQLSAWARAGTPGDAVFLFADSGKQLQSGIFRAEAGRAVYVDWKGGGQVNYLAGLGEQWWSRWRETLGAPFGPSDVSRYRALGIDYLVVRRGERWMGRAAVFENGAYVVYAL